MKILPLLLALAAPLAAVSAPTFPLKTGNGALGLTLDSLRTTASYGGTPAPDGRQWLVLASHWENRIDPKLAAARELPTAYENGDLAKHLYVVIDGRTLGTLAHAGGEQGRPSLCEIRFGKPGDKIGGDLVFDIPAGAFVSADLRYFDDVTGHFGAALAGPTPVSKPVAGPARSAIGEFGLHGIADPARDTAAPPGFRAIAVEIRGRSLWTTEGTITAYDPAVAPGTPVKRANLLDWPETRKAFLVLADGEYAYAAVGGTLPESARFLPGFATGGTLVFFVPEAARSVELVSTMTHVATESGPLELPALRFTLAGKPAAPAPAKLPLQIRDEMFQVGVAARRAAEFAGEKAGDGREFVVLDVVAENTGGGAEYFQPRDQLCLADAEGGATGCDEITARGVHRPEEAVFVPAGAHRRFELVFRTATATTAPRLRFRGGSFEKDFDLPLKP